MDTPHALTTIDTDRIGLLRQRGIVIAGAGLVLAAIGVVLRPADLMPSWLIGFLFCTGLSLGSLSLLMMQHMSGGNWGLVSRRIFEAATRLLPYCVLLFLPVAIFAPKLFLWAQGPEVVQADEILKFKQPYLNLPFFWIRAAVYFLVWLACSILLNRWSAQQDRGEAGVTERDTLRFRVISAPGLVIYVGLMSLAAVDWIMSLDPHWYSTIFGFIMVAGQALSALSFAVAVLALFATRDPMNHVLKAGHFHDLGKLLLAFVMLWAYFSISQLLIIWSANLPEEIPFYLERLQGPLPHLALRPLRPPEAKGDVVEHVEVREERVVLEDGVHVALVRRRVGNVGSVEHDLARRRPLEARDHPEGRRLPAARGTEEGEELPTRHVQVDGVHRAHLGELLRQLAQFDLSARHGFRSYLRA